MSSDARIARAIDLLRANEPAHALDELLEAWAIAPHPDLARHIHMLSESVKTPALATIRGKTAAARAAWDELAADARAVDLPVLLESLCDVTSGDAAKRLAVVASWMPDPRVDAALAGMLESVPYRAGSTRPFWTRLFALLAEMTDPRQVPRLTALTFDAIAATMRDWLRTKRDKLVATLAFDAVDRPARLDELAALAGEHRAAGVADLAEVKHLFDAVYAAPDDDGPRLVLADALIERGDPRGEFISVQLRLAHEPDNKELRTRERDLLDAHGRGWLGELAPIVMADFELERGFLSACKVDNKKLDRVRKLVGHPAWSTVRSIAGSALVALHPVMKSLRALVFEQNTAREHEELPDAWRDLLVDTERPIEELEYAQLRSERQWLDTVEGRRQVDISDHGEVDALCKCVALPKLRALTIREHPVLYIGRLAVAPVLDRLERLGIAFDRNNRLAAQRSSPLGELAKLIADARVPALAVRVGSFHETDILLEGVRGRGYERAKLAVGPTMQSNWSQQLVDEAIRMLDTLPRTIRELRVVVRRHTETQQVARLRAAATQWNPSCELVGF